MTALDWLIVAFVVVLAAQGYRRGFIVGVLGFVGFAAGAIVGTRLGPKLLPSGTDSVWAPAFGLVGALIAGGILATGLEGIGFKLRRGLVLPGLGVVDGALGALLSSAIALGVVWIAAAVAAQAPGDVQLRGDLQQSFIVRALNEILPPSSGVLNALAALDPLPTIAGPAPDVAPPSPAIAHSAGVRAAAPSVVRVVGDACGLGVEGSGWVAGPGLVVTNAHVVAGEHDTTVQVDGDGSRSLPAHAVAFDSHNDIALLRVPGLDEPSLALARDPRSGRSGAILGYPRDGPFDVRAARIGDTQTVLTQDAYGNGPVQRRITPLRGLVRPGNSGGPVIDAAGQVLTTVFASTTGSGTHGGYGVANSVVEGLLAGPHTPVSTGACAA
jgi:S1-C subfamily serine protease